MSNMIIDHQKNHQALDDVRRELLRIQSGHPEAEDREETLRTKAMQIAAIAVRLMVEEGVRDDTRRRAASS